MSDLELDRTYRRDDSGRRVKLIQEWLSLHGYHVKIDGGFGPATEAALRWFQTRQGISSNGMADAKTFQHLVAPMAAALAPIAPQGTQLGGLVAAYAKQH
ncbi:MAG: peptidoglycan-binding domain-containing protein, partial [Acidimicrobiales bacterium]